MKISIPQVIKTCKSCACTFDALASIDGLNAVRCSDCSLDYAPALICSSCAVTGNRFCFHSVGGK